MKKRKITHVLQRRFKKRTEPSAESVDISGLSRFTGLSAARYYDSDVWVYFEQNFPEYARRFFCVSGASKYCYEALDKKIDERYLDELQHYKDQYERHNEAIESIFFGTDREAITVDNRLLQIDDRIKELEKTLLEKQAIYDSLNRKVEQQ